ncbi:MAG: serine/threonine-protein kinase [Myxococcota bacterium]
MITCPTCAHTCKEHAISRQCLQCGTSFEDFYICHNLSCAYAQMFQPRAQECLSCQQRLQGPYSDRTISWEDSSYLVREYLGSGGMGEVYRAIEYPQRGEPREVALKFNKDILDEETFKRFQREVQVLRMLYHPNSVSVYQYGELYEQGSTGMERSAQFMVMELLLGKLLKEWIEPHQLSYRQIVQIIIPICDALQEAHAKNIVHRDVKPQNIMIKETEDGYQPKIFDFGLSKQTSYLDDRLSRSGVVIGTFRYMSPEQAQGDEVNARTDIFSLGVILFELLTKQHPFPAEHFFDLFTLHQQPLPMAEYLPPRLHGILQNALAPQPEIRFSSMTHFRDELQHWLDHPDALPANPTRHSGGSISFNRTWEQKLHWHLSPQEKIWLWSSFGGTLLLGFLLLLFHLLHNSAL